MTSTIARPKRQKTIYEPAATRLQRGWNTDSTILLLERIIYVWNDDKTNSYRMMQRNDSIVRLLLPLNYFWTIRWAQNDDKLTTDKKM